MTDFVRANDHKGEDGKIDWKAYRGAQRDAGEICCLCGKYIFRGVDGHSRNCNECISLITDNNEVDHEKRIRCPYCKQSFDVFGDGFYHLVGDVNEDKTVYCPDCEHDFPVKTTITYNFTSPALVEEKDE